MDDYIRRLVEQQELIRRLTVGPLQHIRDNEAAIARIQQFAQGIDTTAREHLARSLEANDIAKRIQAITTLTDTAFGQFTEGSAVAEMERYANRRRETYEAMERVALPYRALTTQVESMSAYIDATRFTVASIDFRRVGELVTAAARRQELVSGLTAALSLGHADLLVSLNLSEGGLASQPPFVSELPTVDLFVHTGAVRALTPHQPLHEGQDRKAASLRIEVATETAAFLEATLPELKSAFLIQYRGAKACAVERGPDWWTHGSASMRKLLKGVLHTAAPNEAVLPWARQNSKELDRNGRPTRATKVEWLCLPIANDAYRAYMRTEVSSALALIELLDNSQHVDEFDEFEQQYGWIILRVEVAVRHILTVWKARMAQS